MLKCRRFINADRQRIQERRQEVEWIAAKTILQKVRYDPLLWFGMDYTVNLYKGCCHGCIYCDSRSERYYIDDFSRVRGKKDAVSMLRNELKKVRLGFIGLGAMSDPYNPLERRYRLTQKVLELASEFGFGIGIATKSDLVQRDVEALQALTHRGRGAVVKMTITCANDELSRRIEPHVNLSSRRFAAIAALRAAGVCAGILLMPILPFITDTEENIRSIVRGAADAGACFIYAAYGMTLRDRQRQYYCQCLDQLYPGLSRRYAVEFGRQYNCPSPHAKRLQAVLEEECQKCGIKTRMDDIIDLYVKKEEKEKGTQFKLF